MQLKRKIVKFVKFVTAFDPGHKWPLQAELKSDLRTLHSGISFSTMGQMDAILNVLSREKDS